MATTTEKRTITISLDPQVPQPTRPLLQFWFFFFARALQREVRPAPSSFWGLGRTLRGLPHQWQRGLGTVCPLPPPLSSSSSFLPLPQAEWCDHHLRTQVADRQQAVRAGGPGGLPGQPGDGDEPGGPHEPHHLAGLVFSALFFLFFSLFSFSSWVADVTLNAESLRGGGDVRGLAGGPGAHL